MVSIKLESVTKGSGQLGKDQSGVEIVSSDIEELFDKGVIRPQKRILANPGTEGTH